MSSSPPTERSASEPDSLDELQGVVAHEMAHIRNHDVKLMTLLAALIGIIALASDAARRSMRVGSRTRSYGVSLRPDRNVAGEHLTARRPPALDDARSRSAFGFNRRRTDRDALRALPSEAAAAACARVPVFCRSGRSCREGSRRTSPPPGSSEAPQRRLRVLPPAQWASGTTCT